MVDNLTNVPNMKVAIPACTDATGRARCGVVPDTRGEIVARPLVVAFAAQWPHSMG